MANRGYMLSGGFGPQSDDHARWVRLNRIYHQALPTMQQRNLLPHRTGVRWTDGETRLIWTFQDVPLTMQADTSLAMLDGRSEQPLAHNGQAMLPAWGVYRIRR